MTQEEIGAARREAILEVQADSLKEVEAARKKAARALARAEALQDRCIQQVRGGGIALREVSLNLLRTADVQLEYKYFDGR